MDSNGEIELWQCKCAPDKTFTRLEMIRHLKEAHQLLPPFKGSETGFMHMRMTGQSLYVRTYMICGAVEATRSTTVLTGKRRKTT